MANAGNNVQIGFGNCYDAFRHIQSAGGNEASHVVLGAGDSSINLSAADPGPIGTHALKETFVQAVKTELSTGERFVNAQAEARRAQSAKVAGVMKSIAKGFGLTLLALTGIGGLGLLVYYLGRKMERAVDDARQAQHVDDLFADIHNPCRMIDNLPDNEDVEDEDEKNGDADRQTIINQQKEALINDLNDWNGKVDKEAVSQMMDKVESFKAKRTLLEEAHFNAFNLKEQKEKKVLYKNIRKLCKALFGDKDGFEGFRDRIWNAISKTTDKLPPGRLEKFKRLFKESICDRMTTYLMTSKELDGDNLMTQEFPKGTKLSLPGETATKFADALNRVIHEMLVAELDSHLDR